MLSKSEQTASDHYFQFAIQWSSLALLYYDYALTFPMEVRYMWRSNFRLSTVLYIFCRCDTWYKIVGALSVLGRAAVIGEVLSLLYQDQHASCWTFVQALRATGPWRHQRSGFQWLIFEQGLFYFRRNDTEFPRTARFLLHIRKWEWELSHSSTIGDLSIVGQQSAMEFLAVPHLLSTINEDFGESPFVSER
ncbi:hypothetical protein L218DRAFT_987445 [Marasmius fiardii PR-910]|nr:hypothetical protein L218DRAFT_987445 [Marasmius fiardii PR-910]